MTDAHFETAYASLRYFLALMGTAVATAGWMSDAQYATLSGAVVTLATVAFGLYKTFVRKV